MSQDAAVSQEAVSQEGIPASARTTNGMIPGSGLAFRVTRRDGEIALSASPELVMLTWHMTRQLRNDGWTVSMP